MLRRTSACLGLLPILLVSAAARADVIRLKNGGELRGQVERSNLGTNRPTIVIQTLSGGRIVVSRDDIEFVSPRALKVEEYVTRARNVADTVEGHWELAEWCKENYLKEQRIEQLEAVVDLEPDHEKARRALGHTRQNGQWMTRDEWMASRGYIKHKGKYVTQQELDLLEKSAAERQSELEWFPKVRLWFGWASGNNADRVSDGLARLRSINDADAVPALAGVLGKHADGDVRLLYVQILGGMHGDKPVRPLVDRSLFDDSDAVREAALEGIKPEQYEHALDYYVPELAHDSNTIVRRAGGALGKIGDINTVPYLVEALVTEHKWKVRIPATPEGLVDSGTLAAAGIVLPLEVEVALRTGQLPYGAIVIPPPGTRRPMRTVTIKGELKNDEVLAALQKITGEDFGFNKRDWQVWWTTRSKSTSHL